MSGGRCARLTTFSLCVVRARRESNGKRDILLSEDERVSATKTVKAIEPNRE